MEIRQRRTQELKYSSYYSHASDELYEKSRKLLSKHIFVIEAGYKSNFSWRRNMVELPNFKIEEIEKFKAIAGT